MEDEPVINYMEMSKRFIVLMALTLLTAIAFAQANTADTAKIKGVILKSCQKPFENKDLTLCRISADTITYEQLKN
ncbi:MAG: hypothetical protein H0W84_04315, partial [Bacteroidetes bacterium]|nr:hypothetical protein [Bacteroidota bacterium]